MCSRTIRSIAHVCSKPGVHSGAEAGALCADPQRQRVLPEAVLGFARVVHVEPAAHAVDLLDVALVAVFFGVTPCKHYSSI